MSSASPELNPGAVVDLIMWWAREESNLQPSGYERATFTAITSKYWHFRRVRRRMFAFGCGVSLVIHWLSVSGSARTGGGTDMAGSRKADRTVGKPTGAFKWPSAPRETLAPRSNDPAKPRPDNIHSSLHLSEAFYEALGEAAGMVDLPSRRAVLRTTAELALTGPLLKGYATIARAEESAGLGVGMFPQIELGAPRCNDCRTSAGRRGIGCVRSWHRIRGRVRQASTSGASHDPRYRVSRRLDD